MRKEKIVRTDLSEWSRKAGNESKLHSEGLGDIEGKRMLGRTLLWVVEPVTEEGPFRGCLVSAGFITHRVPKVRTELTSDVRLDVKADFV
jgi:hypothetical protein